VCIANGVLASHWQHLPGQATWLVCEAGASGERRYYITNHPPDTVRRMPVRAIKACCGCVQAHQHLKNEAGMGHSEGRSWLGLDHHALLTMVAFIYLQHRRVAGTSKAGKKGGS
jgi:SRSO17 transposase